MKKLTNKALKELLEKIEGQLNDREQWELEDGCYLYKMVLTKDNIEVKVYDSEIKEIYLEYSFVIDIEEDAVTLIKSMITYLYSNEVNYRQAYLRGDKGYYNRKHKSLALWFDRGRLDKVNVIVEDIAKRYKESKSIELEIRHYKGFVSRFYSCLNALEPYWKVAEVKEAISAKIQKLDIKNVEISSIQDRIIVDKSDDDAENVVDTFEIVIGSYVNKSTIVNEVIGRLNKEKVA